ncbi:MAG: hypothetical protein QW751_00285 [Candidatus Aenigmatarchaeota archaeon]|nr:hypothetical protein [Candidatus Aenigmarchaeota archaeon]
MSNIISKDVADEKISSGWLRAWLAFTALAANEDVTRAALSELIDKLDQDARVKLYKKEFGTLEKREKPLKGVDIAWSGTAEVELVTKDFDSLVQIVMQYGPSAVELLEPSKLTINVGEAQNILNSVAQMMHHFAAAGLGGIIFVRGSEQ